MYHIYPVSFSTKPIEEMKPGLLKKINFPENLVEIVNLIESLYSSSGFLFFCCSSLVSQHCVYSSPASPGCSFEICLQYLSFFLFSQWIFQDCLKHLCDMISHSIPCATGLDFVLGKCCLISSIRKLGNVCFLPKVEAELHWMFCLSDIISNKFTLLFWIFFY